MKYSTLGRFLIQEPTLNQQRHSITRCVTHLEQKASLKMERHDSVGLLLQNNDLFKQTWQKEAERGNTKNLIHHKLSEVKV